MSEEEHIYLGSTPRLKVSWRDVDKSMMTPDSQEWKVYDPNNQVQGTNTTPTLESEGVYYWNYSISGSGVAGTWKLIATVTKGSRNGICKVTFPVEEP